MCSSPERQVEISRHLNTNSTLPILVNRESNSDVEHNFFVIEERTVRLKRKASNWQFDVKMKQVELNDMSLITKHVKTNNTFWSFRIPLHGRKKNSWSLISTKVEQFSLRPWRQNSSQYLWRKTTSKIEMGPNYKLLDSNEGTVLMIF